MGPEANKNIAFAMFLFACHLYAGDAVLIVSSDSSVEKYSQAQDAFVASLGKMPITTIDLGLKDLTAAKAKDRIVSSPSTSVYCIGSKAHYFADRFAGDRRIVLSSAINWRRLNTGKHTRVVSNELLPEYELTMFCLFFPQIEKIGIICSRQLNRQWSDEAIAAGKNAQIEINRVFVDETWAVQRAAKRLLEKVDALWLTGDSVVLNDIESVTAIFKLAEDAGVPVFAYSPAFADLGATLMISPDPGTIGQQAARLIQDDGSKTPRHIHPVGSRIVLNLKSAERLGLELNEDALDSVTELIR